MVPHDKLVTLAGALLAKSRKNEVRWVAEPRTYPLHVGNPASFRVVLPDAVVRLMFAQPPSEPDFYQMRIESPDGSLLIGSLYADVDHQEGSDVLESLKSLYQEAYRYATGWDQTLSALEASINVPGPIGELAESVSGEASEPF